MALYLSSQNHLDWCITILVLPKLSTQWHRKTINQTLDIGTWATKKNFRCGTGTAMGGNSVKKSHFMSVTHCLKITHNVVFDFWHFPPSFVLFKLTCLVTMFDRKLQVFKNSPKWTIFGIFNKLLSTQNVNLARFARNVCRMRLFLWFSNTVSEWHFIILLLLIAFWSVPRKFFTT